MAGFRLMAAGPCSDFDITIKERLMKLRHLFVAILALGGMAVAAQATAALSSGSDGSTNLPDTQWSDGTFLCNLDVVAYFNPVPVGWPFGFTVSNGFLDFGPNAPPNPSYKPIQVVFHGSKNGVPDTGSGQYLMNAPLNLSETGWMDNPGGIAGNYVRYAKLYLNGQHICTTNSVFVVLR
jgi:hypothetical protein